MPATRKRAANASAAKASTKTNISIDVAVIEETKPEETKPASTTKTEKTEPEQVEEVAVETVDTKAEETPAEADAQPDGDQATIEAEADQTEEDKEVKLKEQEESANVSKADDTKVISEQVSVEDEPSTEAETKTAGEANVTDSSKKDDSKPDTKDVNGSNKVESKDESGAVEASVTPKRKQYRSMAEYVEDNPYPESLAKLRQLTVNIGPIKQDDLMSADLGKILSLNNEFEIKFSLRDKETNGGAVKKEKLGFVRIPFTIRSPHFLVKVADALGNLHIDGRDMSVKFPATFNTTLEECRAYALKELSGHAAVKKYRQELKSRQILLKHVPAGTEEESIRSLFPEASNVTMNSIKNKEGNPVLSSVTLVFDTLAECKKFYESNKDVQIGDSKVLLIKFYKGDTIRTGLTRGGIARGRGARPVVRGGVSSATRGRGGPTAAGAGQFGSRTLGVKSKVAEIKKTRELLTARGGKTRGVISNLGSQRPAFQKGRGQGTYQGSSLLGSYHSRRNRLADVGQFGVQQSTMNRQSVGRNTQFASPQPFNRGNQSQGEDPMAMMQYLKTTLARMEEKISHSQPSSQGSGRDSGFGRDRSSGGSGFSRMQQDSYNRDNMYTSPGGNRKRRKDSFGGMKQEKRPYMEQQSSMYSNTTSSRDTATSNIWDNYTKYAENMNRYNMNQSTSSNTTAAATGSYNYKGTSGSSYNYGSYSQPSSSSGQQNYGQQSNYYY